MKNVQDVYRLSPLQQDLHAQRSVPMGSRIEYLSWSFYRPLDEAALEAALRELVVRHPALRTAFFAQGLNEPMQVVREKLEPSLEREDLSGLGEPERAARLVAFFAEDRRRGMSLTAAPLVRLVVQRRGPASGRLVFGYHSLVLDEGSALLCVKELLQLYQAMRNKAEPALERSRPYREYLAWVEQQDMQAAEARWRELLKGVQPALLPEHGARGEPAELCTQQLTLSPAVTAQLQGMLRQHKLELGTLLQAAWALLLHQHGHKGDLLFGALVSGRSATLRGSEAMVGRLATVVPRRLAPPSRGPLLRWLRGLQAELSGLKELEHVPASRLRQWLGLAPDTPLFQSAISAEVPAEDDALRTLARGLGFAPPTPAPPATLAAPLTITAEPGPRLALRLHHEARRFASADVARLAGHLGSLLESLATRAEQEVEGALPPLPKAEGAGPAISVPGSRGPGPAEVQVVLSQHPLVREVSVVAGPQGLHAHVVPAPANLNGRPRKLDFGLFFFADEESSHVGNKYRLVLEAVKFGDRQGFTSVWSPERHFHVHGGLYPNPVVLNAALATITERISLRAGSVVLPLHNPLRVAEEWAVVDNLSNGRVALSCASGWVPNDYALAPQNFAKKHEVMYQSLETVLKLWRGEAVPVKDGLGNEVHVHVYPRPVQPELPVWITCSSPINFEKAGELGTNILTSLLTQSLEEAGEKIGLYRGARARAGRAPEQGTATLMMHTFLGRDPDAVLEKVRAPLTAYLRSHVALMESFAKSTGLQVDFNQPEWLDYLASFAFERYYRTGALIGTPTSCLAMVDKVISLGVDEVACFIDFGVDTDSVLESLTHLAELKRLVEDEPLMLQRVLEEYVAERLPGPRAQLRVERVAALPQAAAGAA